jgi:DNA-binding winged helix-turn-helix (wHTH) protein
MATDARQRTSPYRFGPFELDPVSGDLRKSGVRVALQDQPLTILVALLEAPGQVVTREDLRRRLWRDDTFVDFEHGLNAAIKRLRDTLGDAADTPHLIETVPRRGYRFVGALRGGLPGDAKPQDVAGVDGLRGDAAAPDRGAGRPTAAGDAPREPGAPAARRYRAWLPLAFVLVGGLAGAVWLLRPGRVVDPPAIAIEPLVSLPGYEEEPALSPDGKQVAFVRYRQSRGGASLSVDNRSLFLTLTESNEVRRLTAGEADDSGPAWSPDGLWIAFIRAVGDDRSIRVVSALGGGERRLGFVRRDQHAHWRCRRPLSPGRLQ